MHRHVLDAKMLTVFVWLACKNESLCDQWFLYPTLTNLVVPALKLKYDLNTLCTKFDAFITVNNYLG